MAHHHSWQPSNESLSGTSTKAVTSARVEIGLLVCFGCSISEYRRGLKINSVVISFIYLL